MNKHVLEKKLKRTIPVFKGNDMKRKMRKKKKENKEKKRKHEEKTKTNCFVGIFYLFTFLYDSDQV